MVCIAAMMEDQSSDLSLPISVRHRKWQRKEVNYKEVESLKLPRAESIKPKLYPVAVTERNSDRTLTESELVVEKLCNNLLDR